MRPAGRVGPGFVAVLTLAYIGAFIAFVPLLSLIVPLQAQALAPGDKIGLLSLVSLWGALTASVANLAAGWPKPKPPATRCWRGRRNRAGRRWRSQPGRAAQH